MTAAPSDLKTFRTDVVIRKTGLTGNAVGIAPDPAHLESGGYHVGCEDIQRIGRWDRDYSTRQGRDRLDGTNDSAAMDIGDDWPVGGRAAWLRFNNLLVARMRASDPALAGLRAVNFSPDGSARKRYDQNNRGQGVIDSTDSVYMHTHLEWWRDTSGTASRARSLARIGQIIDAAIANKPLTSEDDMATSWDESIAEPNYDAAPVDWNAVAIGPPVTARAALGAISRRVYLVFTGVVAIWVKLGVMATDIQALTNRPQTILTEQQFADLAETLSTRIYDKLATKFGDALVNAIVDPRAIEAYRQGAEKAEDS